MATGVSVTSYDDCYCLDITDESTSGATIRDTGDKYYYYDIETEALNSSYTGESTGYIMTQTIEQILETPTELEIDPSKYPFGMSVSTRTGKISSFLFQYY